jgi:GDP-L-fucose synthase
MGTSCSYDPNLEMKEDNYMKGEPEDGLYTYAMTKRMLLQGLRAIKKQYGLKYSYFIPSTLYGGDYTADDRHFIFDITRKILNGCKGDAVVLWGNGNQRRELIHVSDAVNLIYNLKDCNEEIINLSTGQDDSIKNFANQVCKLVNFDESKIQYDTSKYVGVLKKKLNIDKLKLMAPDYNFKSLEKGLKDLL